MAKHVGKEERRKQLVDAAVLCFAEKGYHGAQVADIIARAGVARGTFYLYFDGKRQIFEEIVNLISRRVLDQIKKIDTTHRGSIPSQIMGNIERPARALLNDISAVKILFNDAVGLDQEFDSLLQNFYKGLLTEIEAALNNGQTLGIIRDGDTKIISIFLLGSIKEVFYQHVLANHTLEADKLIKEIFAFVLHSVIKPSLVPMMLAYQTQDIK